jgi:prepilin-type N-terminal cleavage/methylation domain-containing protein
MTRKTAFKILKKFKDSHAGFTLIELIIVMAIVMLLFGLSWAAFFGLRTTMLLNQSAENIKVNLEYAQRSAMLLTRESGEGWVYGIGVDLRSISENKGYTVFKWCAADTGFHNFPQTGRMDTESVDCSALTHAGIEPIVGKTSETIFNDVGLSFTGGHSNARFILFQSVTGLPYFLDRNGSFLPRSQDVILELNRSGRRAQIRVSSEGDIEILHP